VDKTVSLKAYWDMGTDGKASARLPSWLRAGREVSPDFRRVASCLDRHGLATVCVAARCPNRNRCWSSGTATFMILGQRCTRNCRFCAVEHSPPKAPEADEPARVARAVEELGLRYAVITSVTRDDLPDGGASQFSETVRQIRRRTVNTLIEVLVPDFHGNMRAAAAVLEAGPDVFAHNLETVRRLQAAVRPAADYERSLKVLATAAGLGGARVAVKSGIMVGLGETEEEVEETLRDLRATGCTMVTIGQYLQPRRECMPVRRFVDPETFQCYSQIARELGFRSVVSGPLVRSSFMAAEAFRLLGR